MVFAHAPTSDRLPEPGLVNMPRLLLIPRGIDLVNLVAAALKKTSGKAGRRNRLGKTVLRRRCDEVAMILHKIITGSVLSNRDGQWAPLSRDQGVILCGGNNRVWQALRAFLLEAGIIECDGVSEIDEKCYDYRLTASWEERGISPYTPSIPAITARLDEIFRKNRKHRSEQRPPVAEFLEVWVRRLQLDENEAERAIAGIKDQEARRYAHLVAEIIQLGGPSEKIVHFCAYGRAHSIVTRTPRALRSAFRIDGEPLVEVDVRNCQPLLLGLMTAAWTTRRATARKEPRRSGQEGGRGREEGGGRGPAPYGSADLHAVMLPPDLAGYICICESGRFYKILSATLRMPFSSAAEVRLVKREAMRLIFGRHRPSRPNWVAFATRWPTVAAYLARLKRGDHRRVAHVLQRAESELMIRGVCGELMGLHPDMPLLTIHDALLVPLSGVASVVEAIHRVWGEAGASPALKDPRPA